jgi:hypothetical protein
MPVVGQGYEPALAEDPRRDYRHREIEYRRIKNKATNYRVEERSELPNKPDEAPSCPVMPMFRCC